MSFDPRNRELCVDGACIGLVGRDGHCKECGKPGRSAKLDPRRRGLRDEEDVAEELSQHIIKSDIPGPPPGFEERELCSDGACIGIIGKDGRCKECGLPGAKDASAVSVERTEGDEDEDERDEDDWEDEDEDEDEDEWEDDEGEEDEDDEGEEDEDEDDEGDEDEDDEGEDDEGDEVGDRGQSSGTTAGGFDERQLCPDGACIGLIGRDGRCKECGRPAES